MPETWDRRQTDYNGAQGHFKAIDVLFLDCDGLCESIHLSKLNKLFTKKSELYWMKVNLHKYDLKKKRKGKEIVQAYRTVKGNPIITAEQKD